MGGQPERVRLIHVAVGSGSHIQHLFLVATEPARVHALTPPPSACALQPGDSKRKDAPAAKGAGPAAKKGKLGGVGGAKKK